ncbi:MAG: hypothetical protein AB1652_07805 [Bacillota bacterium]
MISELTKMALTNLRKAFFDLLNVTSEEEWRELKDGYPFERSFDDLAMDLDEWVNRHTGESI